MSPTRVVIAEDHPIVREGIRAILAQAAGIQVVGEARDGGEALSLARALAPDVLLLDMEMPGRNGFQVLEQVRAEALPVRVLVLSGHDSLEYIRGVTRLDVYGYLIKEEALDEIVEAVRGVGRGERGWFSRRVARRIPEASGMPDSRLELLTGREREVLRELAQALTNQEIAAALDISVKTVEKHIESIFGKLQIESRVEAAVWAIEQGY